jgi:hypothetical protein
MSAELPRRLDLWRPAAEDEGVSLIEFTCGMLCARLFDRLVVGLHREWTRVQTEPAQLSQLWWSRFPKASFPSIFVRESTIDSSLVGTLRWTSIIMQHPRGPCSRPSHSDSSVLPDLLQVLQGCVPTQTACSLFWIYLDSKGAMWLSY